MRFEYLVEKLFGDELNLFEMQDKLKALGEQGWELVTVNEGGHYKFLKINEHEPEMISVNEGMHAVLFIFKREVDIN